MDPPRWEEIETAFSELVALDAIAWRERTPTARTGTRRPRWLLSGAIRASRS
jgi:hypothetical protein